MSNVVVMRGDGVRVDFNRIVPIYIQIADAIEDDILAGRLSEGDKCYSQVVIAKELNINPATAAKGIRLLVDRGVLDKVRGQAMIIRESAVDIIKNRRLEETLNDMVDALVAEAVKLGMNRDELIERLKERWK
ncbi:MAG: GntR family transcriptional regulator [Lachnospiraceae bacterium]|nr:GntR family transcriptional regulator [Lachnospiraceae bacterium]